MNKLWSSICHHAQQRPDDAAILSYAQSLEFALTWQQLRDSAQSLAQRLLRDNIKVLALQAGNSPAWILADIACSLQGIIILPLPDFFSDQQIEHALSLVNVDALLSDHVQAFTQSTSSQFRLEGELLGLSYLLANKSSQNRNAGAIVPPQTQKITFTSGSTGTPKGVCLSAEHQKVVCSSLLEATQPCAIERHLCVLPLATLLENIAGVHAPLSTGAQVIVADATNLGFNGATGFALHVFLDALSHCRPNSMILTPQLLEALVLSCDAGWQLPDSLKFIAVGGATVSPELLQRAWAHNLPVYEGYGLSECASVVSLNTPKARKNGSLGKVLPHTQVTIENGEIIVNGPRFLGYVGEPESWTCHTNTQRVATGDLGYFDNEGYLYYQGRRKNLLVSSYGRNIAPEWVEAELNAQAEIGQSIVFGDSQPYCVALIAPRTAQVTHEMINAAVQRVNAKLPSYAAVQRWLQLPAALARGSGQEEDLMTSNGRPRRAQIQKHFQTEIALLYAQESTTNAM